MKEIFGVYVPVTLFVGLCILLYTWPTPMQYLTSLIDGHQMVSYVVFVLLLVSATVFVPVTTVPFIPMVAPIFGPFLTAILSIVGWTLGAVIAFLIARMLGRPLLGHVMSLEKLDESVARIPPETRFVTMVLIRMTLPIDVMSYALGISRSIQFWPYAGATVVGVSWFSFMFSYMGTALFAHNKGLTVLLGIISLVLFLVSWAILIRRIQKHTKLPKK